MKGVTPAVVALFAVVAAPALATEPGTIAAAPSFQVADTGDFASKKAEYESRAQDEMSLWQRRMDEAGAHTHVALDRVWRATKEQWAYLQRATAEGWDRSRAAFESASDRMKVEWHKYYPNEK